MKAKALLLTASTLLLGTIRADMVTIVGAQAARTTINPAISAIPGIVLKATSGASTNKSDVDNALFNLWQLSNGTGDFVAVNYNGGEAAVSSLLSTNDLYGKVPFLSTNQSGVVATNLITNLARPQIAVANTGKISRFIGASVQQLVGGQLVPQRYTDPSDDSVISVSTYGFAADQSFTNTGVTSITAAQARVLFAKGRVPLSFLTGSTNDASATVWLIGRNIDAGARVVVFNEVGAGALSDSMNFKAFSYVTNAGVRTISAIGLTPPTVVNGIPQPPGNDGEAQGSTLIKNLLPVASGTSLNLVTTTVTYGTNVVTNQSVTSTSVTNVIVKTNSYDTYAISSRTVTNFSTNYVLQTNGWTNLLSTNKVIIAMNIPYTNKTAGLTISGYTLKSRIKGASYESTVVKTNVPLVVKGKTKGFVTAFSVNEYYINTNTWTPVLTNVATVVTTTNTQPVYTPTNGFYTVTSSVVSQVLTTSDVVSSIPVPVATGTVTNAWTNTGPNYLLTYDSLANIINGKNTNANGQLPILLSYNGVGAGGVVARTNNTAGITGLVANGAYTLWNFDHLYLNDEGANNPSAIFVRDRIKEALNASVPFPNLKVSDLNVQSTGDGVTPYPKGL